MHLKTLMNVVLLLVAYILLSSNSCKRESSRCHKSLIVINKSKQSVHFAYMFITPTNECMLNGPIYKPNDSLVEKYRGWCVEDVYKDGYNYVVYVVDISMYDTSKNIPCDSVKYHYKILKEYNLTLQDIRNQNFVIKYE